MGENKMSVIKDSDVESIREVAKAVKNYAEGIKNDIDKLMNRHDDMHSVWSGEQYDELTDILVEAKKILSKQSATLMEISEQISDDADRLEKANSTKIK
jgi:uncharacterized protein YukE